MKKFYLLACIPLLFTPSKGHAEDDIFDMLDDRETSSDIDSSSKTSVGNNKILSSFLSSKIPASTARNIEKAEKVFCYTVSFANPGEESYIIDDMAVTGSCGEISETGKNLFRETLWNNAAAFSNNLDSCNISPKIVLRYIYGPDHTDILLSYPCPAVIFFHGRDIVTVNAAPAEKIIEQISTAYSNLSEPYLSPALMKQMVANGQVVTEDQKEMVRRINSSDSSLKKWEKNTPPATTEDNSEQKENSVNLQKGWNKLK